MEYLPAEIQFKILKNLNFDELFSIKQTNKYFYEFINKYEGSFARKKFKKLFFMTTDYELYNQFSLSLIRIMSDVANNFPLSNHLQEKWQATLDKQIPVLLLNAEAIVKNMELNIANGNFIFENTELIAVRIEPFLYFTQEDSKKKNFTLKLPLFPKTIEELKIIRYWLEQIVRCDFVFLEFNEIVFNPEMIELLFDNEIIKLKFNCQVTSIFFKSQNIDSFKFTFDRLIIRKHLVIIFYDREEQQNIEEENNFLFNLLLNEGYRIPKIILDDPSDNNIVLYNNLINIIETSTDLSKIVAKIEFDCNNWPLSKLIVRGVETIESNDEDKYYKITNIYNPKIIFLVSWITKWQSIDFIDYIEIKRLY